MCDAQPEKGGMRDDGDDLLWAVAKPLNLVGGSLVDRVSGVGEDAGLTGPVWVKLGVINVGKVYGEL